MTIAFGLIIAIGAIAAIAGGIWFLVIAFRTSVAWGLASLLIPFAGLVFLAKHWDKARTAFIVNIAGTFVFAGAMMGLAAYKASSAVVAINEDPYSDYQVSVVDDPPSEAWLPEEVEPTSPPLGNDVAADPADPGYVEVADDEGEPVDVIDSDRSEPEPTATAPVDFAAAGPVTPARQWGRPVSREELPTFIGEVIEIHSTDKQAFKAVLLDFRDDVIKIRQAIGTGHMIYFMEWDKIIEIRVKKEKSSNRSN